MMNKIVTLLSVVAMLLVLGLGAQTPLTDDERKDAVKHLKSSKKNIEKTVKGLSEAQLNFKPSEDAWSVAQCMEHLAISEGALFSIVEGSLQNEPDPSLRSEVKMSDQEVLGFIQDRSTKIKTQPPLEPSNKFDSFQGSVQAFSKKRAANIEYLKTTDDDLRNRYHDFPFGKLDSYQVVLFMSGHSLRHLQQIKEVMEDPAFPNG